MPMREEWHIVLRHPRPGDRRAVASHRRYGWWHDKPEGFVIMNVRVPCVKGYNEDQIAIVLEDPEMKDCPVVLGTPTLFRVMEVIKESKIRS